MPWTDCHRCANLLFLVEANKLVSGIVSSICECVCRKADTTYLLNDRSEGVCERHVKPLEGDLRRLATPIQRADVVGLRRWDLMLDLLFPRVVRCLGLRDAQLC